MPYPDINYLKNNNMNTINKDQKSEQNEKHTGGGHIFIALGIAVVAIILIKILLDWLMK